MVHGNHSDIDITEGCNKMRPIQSIIRLSESGGMVTAQCNAYSYDNRLVIEMYRLLSNQNLALYDHLLIYSP